MKSEAMRSTSDSAPMLQAARPHLALVTNVPTPYRLHLYQRFAAEIPELGLISVFTHTAGEFRWAMDHPPEIGTVFVADRNSRTTGTWHAEMRRGLKLGRAAIQAIEGKNVKAVICMGYSIPMLRVLHWAHRRKIPAFLRGDSNIRGNRPRTPLHASIKRRIVRYALRMSDGVMPMGELGQAYFEQYGATRDNFFFVPYEPDYTRFESVTSDVLNRFCESHDISLKRRWLLYSGRLTGVKRVDLLLDAFAALAAERPEWGLLIVGAGELQVELEARARPRERVKFIGFLEHDEIPLAYHAADVLVLPSDHEPWAVVVTEAMAAHLPVVASDVVGAAHELVEPGSSGEIFPAGDVRALTSALRKVTAPGAVERYSQGADASLAAWRKRADPVTGVRQALACQGVI